MNIFNAIFIAIVILPFVLILTLGEVILKYFINKIVRVYLFIFNKKKYMLLCGEDEKKPEKAVEFFTQIIQKYPDCCEAYNGRGNNYILQGKFEAAKNDFIKALEINPESINALCGRGYSAMDLRENDAEEYFQKAVKLEIASNGDTSARVSAAVFYYTTKEFLKALEYCNMVLKIAPGIASMLNMKINVAEILINKSEFGKFPLSEKCTDNKKSKNKILKIKNFIDLVMKNQFEEIKNMQGGRYGYRPVQCARTAAVYAESRINKVSIDEYNYSEYCIEVIRAIQEARKEYYEFNEDEEGFASSTFHEITRDVIDVCRQQNAYR